MTAFLGRRKGVGNIQSVYFLSLSQAWERPVTEQLLCRVSPEKRQRIEGMAHWRDQKRSLYGALLIRHLACTCLGLPNEALRFAVGDKGKPYLTGYPQFQYSLSHSGDGVAVGVTDGVPIGVDVEPIREYRPALANRFFAPGEQAYLHAQPEEAERRFYEIWTQKEAWLKRDGRGITVDLRSFDVTAPPCREELTVLRQGDYLVAVCSHHAPSIRQLELITEEALISAALALSPAQ